MCIINALLPLSCRRDEEWPLHHTGERRVWEGREERSEECRDHRVCAGYWRSDPKGEHGFFFHIYQILTALLLDTYTMYSKCLILEQDSSFKPCWPRWGLSVSPQCVYCVLLVQLCDSRPLWFPPLPWTENRVKYTPAVAAAATTWHTIHSKAHKHKCKILVFLTLLPFVASGRFTVHSYLFCRTHWFTASFQPFWLSDSPHLSGSRGGRLRWTECGWVPRFGAVSQQQSSLGGADQAPYSGRHVSGLARPLWVSTLLQ